MPVTEIAVVPLKPGAEIGDPNNEAAVVLKEIFELLKSVQGVGDIYFGTFVEDPDKLHVTIDWDSLDDGHAFQMSPAFQDFVGRIMSIATGKPIVALADFTPHPGLSQALSAPVTEVATFYIGKPEYPEDFKETMPKFLEAVEAANIEGFHGGATGTTTGDIETDGISGKGAMLLMGWDSVDAHMKFRETTTFKENVGHFKVDQIQKAEVHHAVFMRYIA